ncbi:hypothetical protein [Ruminiclostridium josui]|uniref:hypothetical protein n=1 Tax=Ruminiclostridium josui TaxID=1499 RepID=UPI0004637B86|nr:hypothetical protein [Ruminiclostridium josui]
MGCFGGSNGFDWWWIIILLIIIFCCCGNDGFFGGSDFFNGDCEWLVCLAVILLVLFLCNSGDCCD